MTRNDYDKIIQTVKTENERLYGEVLRLKDRLILAWDMIYDLKNKLQPTGDKSNDHL